MIDRPALAMELERVRVDFYRLLMLVTDDEWDRWTSGSGQLAFLLVGVGHERVLSVVSAMVRV